MIIINSEVKFFKELNDKENNVMFGRVTTRKGNVYEGIWDEKTQEGFGKVIHSMNFSHNIY